MRIQLFTALLLLTSSYALWRGGAPERIVGSGFLVANFATWASYSPHGVRFSQVETSVLVVDLLLLSTLVAVALKADRGWTLVVAGLQLSAVGAHLVKAFAPDTLRVAYAVLIMVWAWPTQLLLWVGTWRHVRRVSSMGTDRDWSLPRPPSESTT